MEGSPPTPPGHPRPAIRRRASAHRDALLPSWLRRRRPWITAICLLAVVLAGGIAVGSAVSGLGSVPDDTLVARPLPSDTLVYDRTGKVLVADLHPEGYQHYQVTLAAMGAYLPAATVAIEDAG